MSAARSALVEPFLQPGILSNTPYNCLIDKHFSCSCASSGYGPRKQESVRNTGHHKHHSSSFGATEPAKKTKKAQRSNMRQTNPPTAKPLFQQPSHMEQPTRAFDTYAQCVYSTQVHLKARSRLLAGGSDALPPFFDDVAAGGALRRRRGNLSRGSRCRTCCNSRTYGLVPPHIFEQFLYRHHRGRRTCKPWRWCFASSYACFAALKTCANIRLTDTLGESCLLWCLRIWEYSVRVLQEYRVMRACASRADVLCARIDGKAAPSSCTSCVRLGF